MSTDQMVTLEKKIVFKIKLKLDSCKIYPVACRINLVIGWVPTYGYSGPSNLKPPTRPWTCGLTLQVVLK